MNKKTGAAGAKSGSRFSTSLVVGLLLVPLSAVAAVALVNPDAEATPEETVAAEVVVETTTTTIAEEVVVPEFSSDEDLWEACGEQGLVLVTKEADESISPLEQAALDSLRAICLSEGLELPGPPAPEAVVQTVTVVASPPPVTVTTTDPGTDEGDESAAEFEAAYAATVAHINKAIADGANGEKITLAQQYLGEAGALADAGDYDAGMDRLSDARDAADAASRGTSHDDDDDDDEDDDHDEDEEDEEDDDDHGGEDDH